MQSERNKIIVAILGWLLGIALMTSIFIITDPLGGKVGVNEAAVWNAVQSWRVSSNMPAYIKDPSLCEAADKRLFEVKKTWSHSGFYSLSELLPEFERLGENLSRNMSGSQTILEAWLDSPDHKKNLDDDFTHGCIKCGDNFCVHIFGSRQ